MTFPNDYFCGLGSLQHFLPPPLISSIFPSVLLETKKVLLALCAVKILSVPVYLHQ